MVCETVQERGGQLGIAEHAGPFAEAQIRLDDHAGVLVELAEQVEQQSAARSTEGQIALLVERHHVHVGQAVCHLSGFVADLLLLRHVDQLDRGEETDPAPMVLSGSLGFLPFGLPDTCKGGHAVVRTVVAHSGQVGVHLLDRAPLFARFAGLSLEPACQFVCEGVELAGAHALGIGIKARGAAVRIGLGGQDELGGKSGCVRAMARFDSQCDSQQSAEQGRTTVKDAA